MKETVEIAVKVDCADEGDLPDRSRPKVIFPASFRQLTMEETLGLPCEYLPEVQPVRNSGVRDSRC